MSNRPEKRAIIAEITERVQGADFAFVVDYRGLKVEQLAELRRRLREVDTRVTIVKNTLLARVLKDEGLPSMDGMLSGPTALLSGADAAAAAKALEAFIKEVKLPVVKGGQLDRRALTAADVHAIATIPPREQLLAMVVGTIAAPMAQLVGVMQQKLASLVYVLKAVEDKKRENA